MRRDDGEAGGGLVGGHGVHCGSSGDDGDDGGSRGGGASYTAAAVTEVTHTQGYRSGDGTVTLSW